MGSFTYFEHTADVGIEAIGSDLRDVFVSAALALFSLIADVDQVREETQISLHVNGDGLEDLLVSWLNELIFVFDVEHLLFRRFEINHLDSNSLDAVCYGEKYNPDRHHLKAGVKAATHHEVTIERSNGGYRARLIVDV